MHGGHGFHPGYMTKNFKPEFVQAMIDSYDYSSGRRVFKNLFVPGIKLGQATSYEVLDTISRIRSPDLKSWIFTMEDAPYKIFEQDVMAPYVKTETDRWNRVTIPADQKAALIKAFDESNIGISAEEKARIISQLTSNKSNTNKSNKNNSKNKGGKRKTRKTRRV